jgi:hypothetical protein
MGTEAQGGDRELGELVRKLEDPSFFERVGHALHAKADRAASSAPTTQGIAEAIRTSGWSALEAVLAPSETRPLIEAIDALGEEGVPPLFVYAFEATWEVGARIARTLSAALCAPYVVLADAWAFRVAPGPDHAGWSPHRGTYELASDRSAPDSLNVWVALTDATVDNACMHLVPLDDDPGYPSDLRSHAAAERARPLPVPAGTALFWNANVLHSGGRSSARARAPRISLTFTLRRADHVRVRPETPAFDEVGGDLRARLDVIAAQIRVYGELERTLPDVFKRWANVTLNLRDLFLYHHTSEPRKAL